MNSPNSIGRLRGPAYILMKVRPGSSNDIAKRLIEEYDKHIAYAMGVWGPWDVVVRATTANTEELVEFLEKQQQKELNLLRTETLIIRSDQKQIYKPSTTITPNAGGWAILLLTTAGRRTQDLLCNFDTDNNSGNGFSICNGRLKDNEVVILDGAGVLGQYDIILTVRYAEDKFLAKFVMEYLQLQLEEGNTTTMPAIQGMTYPEIYGCEYPERNGPTWH